MNKFRCAKCDFVFSRFIFLLLCFFSSSGSNGKWFGILFSFVVLLGAAVSGAINKDKENAVKKSDKNESEPKR